jgi:hypothetical protein
MAKKDDMVRSDDLGCDICVFRPVRLHGRNGSDLLMNNLKLAIVIESIGLFSKFIWIAIKDF